MRPYISAYVRRLKNHFCMHHPHVIKLRDVFVTPHHLNIVLELAEGGMLFDYVNARLKEGGGRMQEDDARLEGCGPG